MKYIGLNHYRRYLKFLNNIPNLDKIFENYDIILNKKLILRLVQKVNIFVAFYVNH